MPDYNLAGLSPRSFEQLIQSIATKVIGPNVVIFGDGPDGGREATFEGPIPYPNREYGWNGYGVIQAKFRQKPEGTLKDGEWAIKQLRGELEKFSNPDKPRRKPDYYIYATNVVLSPVETTGAKDKIAEVFKEFESKLSLKGYDVWDYDKIRSFIDANEDIRTSNAAWILPGDVLSQVIKWFSINSPDFERTLNLYLQKELLIDQYVNLEQAGYKKQHRIPIARVFIDLPTFDRRLVDPPNEAKDAADKLPSGFIAEILKIAADRLDPRSYSFTKGEAQSFV